MMQENLMMYEKYKKTSAATMSPGRLLIMLYDRAIKAVEDAIDNIDDQQAAEAHKHIIKAQDIVLELRNTLNMASPRSCRNCTIIFISSWFRPTFIKISCCLKRSCLCLQNCGRPGRKPSVWPGPPVPGENRTFMST